MRLKEEEFIRVMSLYEGSGLNVTAFCKKHGISKTRFYQYQRNRNQLHPIEPSKGIVFEEISLLPKSEEGNPVSIVIYFPNNIHCELKLKGKEARFNLLRELASLC